MRSYTAHILPAVALATAMVLLTGPPVASAGRDALPVQDGVASNAGASTAPAADRQTIASVQRALLRLPYYGVFDFLAFGVEEGTITLMGYAHRENLRSDAEGAVRHAMGVVEVANRIELLPASPLDDRIRRATFYRLYGDDHFARYTSGGAGLSGVDAFNLLARFPNMQPLGMYPVHIIVKHLRVTLFGMVDTALDKSVALTRARGVSGALAVEDNIFVRERSKGRR